MTQKWIDHNGNEVEPGVIKVDDNSITLVSFGDDVFQLSATGLSTTTGAP